MKRECLVCGNDEWFWRHTITRESLSLGTDGTEYVTGHCPMTNSDSLGIVYCDRCDNPVWLDGVDAAKLRWTATQTTRRMWPQLRHDQLKARHERLERTASNG